MYFIEKFDREITDGHYLRQPVFNLVILPETVKRENFDGSNSTKSVNISPIKKLCYKVLYKKNASFNYLANCIACIYFAVSSCAIILQLHSFSSLRHGNIQ